MKSNFKQQKGYKLEWEVVTYTTSLGFESKRAYGSNGAHIGLDPKVDVVVDGLYFQCKRVKKKPAKLTIPKEVDGIDTGTHYIMRIEAFFEQLYVGKPISLVEAPMVLGALYKPCSAVFGQIVRADFQKAIVIINKWGE